MLKLNLGSGNKNLKGYENIDLINGQSAYPLQYETESVDEIRASHILEHFGRNEVKAVLKNWIDKLRPGGILKIAVPGIDKLYEAKAKGVELPCTDDAYIMGGQTDENDYHKSIFTEASLYEILQSLGLDYVQPWESEIDDCASLPISVNLQGQKKAADPIQIQAVMSMPRLAFTDNMYAAISVFPQLGIGFSKGTGVFWGQVLSRLIEKFRTDGTEYIITCDYDTWFKKEHVIKLLQYMQENPELDAVVPVQIKRENHMPMFAPVIDEGETRKEIPLTEFDRELEPIVNGHFGLTVFRVSAFDDLKKPWFIAHPNENGDWGENRIDEDIHFWHNFRDCGRKVALATKVNIGHMQMMCTFPGEPRKGYEPIQYYMPQMDRGEYAEHCVPNVEMKT